jgi:hypothetical protein
MRFTIRELMGLVVIAAIAVAYGKVALAADTLEEFVGVTTITLLASFCYVGGMLLFRVMRGSTP